MKIKQEWRLSQDKITSNIQIRRDMQDKLNNNTKTKKNAINIETRKDDIKIKQKWKKSWNKLRSHKKSTNDAWEIITKNTKIEENKDDNRVKHGRYNYKNKDDREKKNHKKIEDKVT